MIKKARDSRFFLPVFFWDAFKYAIFTKSEPWHGAFFSLSKIKPLL